MKSDLWTRDFDGFEKSSERCNPAAGEEWKLGTPAVDRTQRSLALPTMVLQQPLELIRLTTRMLDSNPETRITIPDIMNNKWFKKWFKLCSVVDDDDVNFDSLSEHSQSESDSELEIRRKNTTSLPRPASMNAFDIISFLRGFDLSGLFEEGANGGARYITAAPVSSIISKLEEIAKVVSFTVRKKDCRVSLEGLRDGVKGPLTIAAEIFELTPLLNVVDVKRKRGDRLEYEEFCNGELKLGLQSLMMGKVADSSDLPSDNNEYRDTNR